jgi:hypothetical protein
VTPAADAGFGIAHALRALPASPMVILTSSADRNQFGTRLKGYRFIAKADICTAAIAHLVRTTTQTEQDRKIADVTQNAPTKTINTPTSVTGIYGPHLRDTRQRDHVGSRRNR